jgi:MoaA/NifB/PqqE/SkfB family radical SAM enzyme
MGAKSHCRYLHWGRHLSSSEKHLRLCGVLSKMKKEDFETEVDDAGRLILPPAVAKQYGLEPGIKVRVGNNANGLHLHRPVTHLARIYIEPTNRCNLSCVTCIRNSWDEPLGEMSSTAFSRIVEGLRFFSSPPSVFLGGLGEPLGHPHIVEMVREIKALGSSVELITNGTLLTKSLSTQLIDAGLDMLWVSLDGATPDSYTDVRLGAALPEVLANLRDFRHARWTKHFPVGLDLLLKPQLGIVFVAMKRNIADLPAVFSLANQLGSLHFLVTNVLPYTPEMEEEILYSRAITDTAYTSAPLLRSLDFPKMDISPTTREAFYQAMRRDHSVSISGASLGERNNQCPFIEKGSLAIRWDGDVSPCLALLHDHKVYFHKYERSLKRHAVGNVREQSIGDIWNKQEYLSFRKRIQEFDFSPCVLCGGCDLFESNQEDCIGSPVPACGGCLWAQGIIRCP